MPQGSQLTATQVLFTLFSVIVVTAGLIYEVEHPAVSRLPPAVS